MKKVLVFVSSLDGKVTRWDNPYVKEWSSESDKEYFHKVWKSSSIIIMGINTFLADPLKPSAGRFVIVMTRHPQDFVKYKIQGQIEFSDESPDRLIRSLEPKGYNQLLIVGGPRIAASFLKAGLIDELWLTIEPKIFGEGKNLTSGEKLDIDLRLISCERANEDGTLITKYAVLKRD